MADLIDEYGNPVQLTDEHGNPVRLTDEHGNPMQLTGVATSPTKTTVAVVEEVPLPGGAAVVEEVPLPGGAAAVEEVPLPGGAAARVEVSAPGGVTTVPAAETTHVMSGPGTGVVSGAQLDPLVTGGIMGSAQPQDVGIGGAGGTGHHQLKDQLHRSTSSSSSEDDGQGGRRKKGIKQKLKETFGIGKHKHAQEHTPQGSGGGVNLATPAVGEAPHHEHEKKGVMEKIKEKLPGHHHTSEGK